MNGGNDETTAIILILAGTLLSGCGKETNTPAETNEKPFEPVVTTVKDVNHFGDVFLDLEEIDLAYGDSINIRCSNGYERTGLPYYSEFYGTYDTVLLTDRFADM